MNPNQTPQATQHGKPGAMTTAMQAVQVKATGPKVLRIGLIQGGKIIEERIIRKRASVTVGSSEKNHFVVHTDGLPARFELFQLVGNDYILNFTASMQGRVGLPGGVQDLAQMRSSGMARNAGTFWQVKLNESSRGKVILGKTTLLFQFVVPPPVQPRPQLPAAVRSGFVGSIDWVFTAFVVFTFMSMFSFLVYLENADWPIERGLAAVPEDFANIIFQEPPPPVEVEQTATEEGPGEEAAQAKETKTKGSGKSNAAPGMSAEEAAAAAAAKSARIAAEATQAAEALIVGALSSSAGGALADVLAGGAVIGNAEEIMAQASGVGVARSSAGGTLRSRSGGGTGSGTSGLGSLARAGGADATSARGEGKEVTERQVRGQTTVGSGGDIGGSGEFDSSVVVNAIKLRISAIKICYERELKRNPSLAGKVTVQFSIQPQGNVTDVQITGNTTTDNAVAECVASAVRRFRFNPGPKGGSVSYSYPFVFAPQN
jgi:TonB family protein